METPTGNDKFIGATSDHIYETSNREILFGYAKYDESRDKYWIH